MKLTSKQIKNILEFKLENSGNTPQQYSYNGHYKNMGVLVDVTGQGRGQLKTKICTTHTK